MNEKGRHTYTVHSLEEMQDLARWFVEEYLATLPSKTAATVVGLYGELGSGKTSFTQGLARALGVEETVVSPTFVIEKIYELKNTKLADSIRYLIHIDAYRLEKSQELLHLGWADIIANPENLILVEWPERVADIMPEHIQLKFAHVSEEVREVEIVS